MQKRVIKSRGCAKIRRFITPYRSVYTIKYCDVAPLLHRYTPVEEQEGNQQNYYCHSHNAPHECLVAFTNVAFHNIVSKKCYLSFTSNIAL